MKQKKKWISIIGLALLLPLFFAGSQEQETRREAMYYKKVKEPDKAVRCELCPRRCLIPKEGLGFCRARKNIDGKLYSLGYSNPCTVHVDPIEKKPFFHVLPSSNSLSIASAGCNLRCIFCQNWQISQFSPLETRNYFFTPDKIVRMALANNCKSIAYTYSEPTNFYEYMLDTAKIANEKGILNVMHSNGYINPVPLRKLCEYLDAANIDLKGFTEKYYREMSQAELKPVLVALKILKEEGVWLEITNLIVPGKNDDPGDIRRMCEWIRKNLGPDIPVHFSRFHPTYKLKNLPPTPIETLEMARDIAQKAGLYYAYIGNVPGHNAESTYCPKCGKAIIKRVGYKILEINISEGKCRFCGAKMPGIWK